MYGNSSGFHSVGWSTVVLSKSETGFGIKNLKLVKHAIMAKNILALLNSENKIWIDIFKDKYRVWHPWFNNHSTPSSWFFKSICQPAELLKPHFRIISINPAFVNILNVPCLLDLPILYKSTFINMDAPWDNIHSIDLINGDELNLSFLNVLFSNNINLDWINNIKVDSSTANIWAWALASHKSTIPVAVYDHLNSNGKDMATWKGWDKIWKLLVIPRIKTFIWKLAHGKLTIGALLYALNVGPFTLCPFCGLAKKIARHIMWDCCKLQQC